MRQEQEPIRPLTSEEEARVKPALIALERVLGYSGIQSRKDGKNDPIESIAVSQKIPLQNPVHFL